MKCEEDVGAALSSLFSLLSLLSVYLSLAILPWLLDCSSTCLRECIFLRLPELLPVNHPLQMRTKCSGCWCNLTASSSSTNPGSGNSVFLWIWLGSSSFTHREWFDLQSERRTTVWKQTGLEINVKLKPLKKCKWLKYSRVSQNISANWVTEHQSSPHYYQERRGEGGKRTRPANVC